MTERKGNRTERLQIRYRNQRYGWGDGCYSGEVPTRPLGTVIEGDPKRRAKYREVTVRTQQILDQALELSLQGKSAVEILSDLDLPTHND